MSTTLSTFNDLPFAGFKIEAKPTGSHMWGLWFGDIILADAMTQDEATYFAEIHKLRVEAEKEFKPSQCAAVVLMTAYDPTMIMLRQEIVCADDIEGAIEIAKESAIQDNPGWIVQCASALNVIKKS